MSIDISVLIWTVLSFIVLMFLLNRLLFRPILQVLDQRQRKIDEGLAAGRYAQEAVSQRQQQSAKQLEHCRLEELERVRIESLRVEAALETALCEGDTDLQDKREHAKQRVEEERQALYSALSSEVPRYAALIAEKLCAESSASERSL